MDKIKDIDIYELLNIPITADERMVKKAYRKKALACHPDKNPNNPRAAALFLEISQALEVLLDQVKRALYDKEYNAKKAAKIRHEALDARRKKFKEDLEYKERLAQSANNTSGFKSSEQNLKQEIERLRKEGSRQLKEEMETVRQQIFNEELSKTKADQIHVNDGGLFKLKIKWKSDKDDIHNGGYDREKLSKIFSKYGNVGVLVVSQKKKGSGLIEFENSESALTAFQLEQGYPQNPLKLSWLNGNPSLAKQNKTTPLDNNKTGYHNLGKSTCLFPSVNTFTSTSKDKCTQNSFTSSNENDYEALVFAKLREAEEKKLGSTNLN